MCEKRDQFKKSYHQAANERDSLAAQVAQLQRKLTELDSSSTKKEASALRMVCFGVLWCVPMPCCDLHGMQ